MPNQAGLYPIHLVCVRAWNQGIKVLLAVASTLVHQRSLASCNNNKEEEEQWLPIDWTLYAHERLQNELSNRAGTTTTSTTTTTSSSTTSSTTSTSSSSALLIPDFSKCTEQELLSLQLDYDECLEMLLLTSYTGRAVFSCDGSSEELFLPAHALLTHPRHPPTHWKYALHYYYGTKKQLHFQSVDHLGRSPLHVLLEEGDDYSYSTDVQVAIIRELHQLAPDVFAQVDAKGRIPLQIAILEDAPKEIVQVLVECGGPTTVGIKWKPPLVNHSLES